MLRERHINVFTLRKGDLQFLSNSVLKETQYLRRNSGHRDSASTEFRGVQYNKDQKSQTTMM